MPRPGTVGMQTATAAAVMREPGRRRQRCWRRSGRAARPGPSRPVTRPVAATRRSAMAPLRALLTAALVAAAAAAPSESGAQGRYFPGLPTPLAPFIDFYETHIEPEDFVVLRGVSGTLAFVTFAFLMLAANMGLLPLNPAQLREDDFGKFKPLAPEHVNNAISYEEARSNSNLIDEEPLTTRLPSCVPLLLCSLEVHGWTLPLQSSDSLLQRWRRPEPEETDPERRPEAEETDPERRPEAEETDPERRPAAASGDLCRRFRAVCAVPLLSDRL